MEHKTALALAGAVVMVGASGAVVVGTVTGAVGPNIDDVRPVTLPRAGARAAEQGQAGEGRATGGRQPAVQRVTRYVDVPMPAPAAQPAPPVAPPLAGTAAAPPSAAAAVPERARVGGDGIAAGSAEGREERSEYEDELREERSERLEDAREERQDRFEDLSDDNSGPGGDSEDSEDSGHGGHGHG